MGDLFKKNVLLFCFCFTTILYYSCTQEKEFVNEHNHGKIDFKEKSFKEALSLPLFNNAIQKVAKKRGAFRTQDDARTALEDQYGFTIVTDAPIRIITDENGTVFYTILIEREVKEEMVFENLMIKVQDDETAAVILKYTMEEKGIVAPTGEYTIKDITSTLYTDLNVEGRMFFNGNGDTCFDTLAFMCDDALGYTHTAYGACFQNGTAYAVISSVCMNDNVIGNGETINVGGGDTTSSNNTGGLGAGGGSLDPITMSPIICRTGNCIELNIETPCEELEKFYNKPTVNTLSNNLIPKLNLVNENGFDATVSLSPSGDIIYNFSEAPPEICKPNRIIWPKKNNRVIIDHTHTIAGDSYQIPSIEDVFALYQLTQDFDVVPFNYNTNMFHIALTVDGFKYAIKISDFDKLNDIFYAISLNKLNKMGDELNDRMLSLGTPNTALPNPMAKEFLLFCKNFGIKLYRKSTELTDTSWNELKLNNNESDIEEIPCPN